MATLVRHIFFPSSHIEASPSTPFIVSSHCLISLPLSSPSFSSLSYSFHAKTRRPTRRFRCSFSSVAVGTPELGLDAKQEGAEEGEELSKTRLIAQNVPWSCTAEDVRSLFGKYGTVVDVELSMYNKTRNRGLAFVEMSSPEEAQSALSNLESSEYEGRTLRLNYAKPPKKKPSVPVQERQIPTFNLFVANLSYEVRSKDLKEFFDSEGSGVVASAEVIFHENPRSPTGYGFVAFKSKKAAEAALTAFQAKVLMGRPIRIAKSKQFVKLPKKESPQSSDASVEVESVAEAGDASEEATDAAEVVDVAL